MVRTADIVIEVGDPKVERLAFMSWIGSQRISRTSADGKQGSTQVITVWARTRGSAYKKLAKRQEQETDNTRKSVRQVQKGGHGSVQVQAGGRMISAPPVPKGRTERPSAPPTGTRRRPYYDPALDWPDRYPDGGQ